MGFHVNKRFVGDAHDRAYKFKHFFEAGFGVQCLAPELKTLAIAGFMVYCKRLLDSGFGPLTIYGLINPCGAVKNKRFWAWKAKDA